MAEKVILVRHGETEWSKNGRHTSVTDLALTETGQKAASALEIRLDAIPIDQVLVSPRRRARDTAALALPQAIPEITEDLAEWNYGDYEGLTTETIHEQDPTWNLWSDGCPGGESPAQMTSRMNRLMDRFDAIEGTVACFAHGHVLRTLGICWLGLPLTAGSRFTLDTSSISVLGYAKEERALFTWNA